MCWLLPGGVKNRDERSVHASSLTNWQVSCIRLVCGGAIRTTPDWKGRGTMRVKTVVVLGLALPCACGAGEDVSDVSQAAIGSAADPNPHITFTQVAKTVGIDRTREPASAGRFDGTNTLAYGSWLADLDGDGRLDYYAVNHGQTPHLSWLFLNNGAGGFGQNLFTVGFQSSTANPPNLGNSNEMRFVGDLNGDGRVDFFFLGWSGFGTLCVNQGVAQHADWTGPSFTCYGTADGLAFADVNGDGKIDVLSLDISNFDTYTAYYSQTAPYLWRLNNGDPNINHWPTTTNFTALRITDPNAAAAAPFLDLNNDGIPDKIVGIPQPSNNRGPYGTSTAGQQVFLGRPAVGTCCRPPPAWSRSPSRSPGSRTSTAMAASTSGRISPATATT